MKWFAAFSNDMIVRNDIQQGAQKNIPGKPPILTQKGQNGAKVAQFYISWTVYGRESADPSKEAKNISFY